MSWFLQSFRFFVVGISSNALLFFLYLLSTSYGIGHKTAMTLLYIIGVTQTFIFNKKWTFSHSGTVKNTFWRYITVYGVGYLMNLTILAICVDALRWPHQYVQGVTILIIAVWLFLTQKFWVFPKVGKPNGE